METYAFVQWGMKFPALTLMVLTRPDIGYRLLNPLTLVAVFGLLAILAVLATPGHEAAHPEHLLIFAGVGFISGLVQKIRRWSDLNRGVIHHSYYIGTSRLDFRWLPHFVRRNRRVARYVEPILFAGIGIALLPYSHALAMWLVFAAFCLRGFEDQVFRRERNRDLDLMDSIIVAEEQTRVLEQYEQAKNPPKHQASPGIPSGLGPDLQAKINKHGNPSLSPMYSGRFLRRWADTVNSGCMICIQSASQTRPLSRRNDYIDYIQRIIKVVGSIYKISGT